MPLSTRASLDGDHITLQQKLLLQAVAREVGISEVLLAQGSWSDGSASAGTHSGSGAADIRLVNIPAAKQIPFVVGCRKRGAAATWLRKPWPQGDHIHSLMGCGDETDDPRLADSAKRQVQAWVRGRNGLASNGPDPDPRPKLWPIVRWSTIAVRRAGKRRAVYSTQVLRVQRSLARYVGLNYATGPGFWGKRTDAAWLEAAAKSGYDGPELLAFLGYRYGYRPGR